MAIGRQRISWLDFESAEAGLLHHFHFALEFRVRDGGAKPPPADHRSGIVRRPSKDFLQLVGVFHQIQRESGGIIQSDAGYVSRSQKWPGKSGQIEVGEAYVNGVGDSNSAPAGAADVGNCQAIHGFKGKRVGGVEERAAIHNRIGNGDVSGAGNRSVAGEGIDADDSGIARVEAYENLGGCFQIVCGDVFEESAPAGAAFDVDRIGTVGEDAVVDADVADSAGHFRSDPDAGETAAEGAISDDDVFRWPGKFDGGSATAALEGDAIITRIDVAVVDSDVGAGIDVDAVAVALRGADGQISGEHVLAIEEMDGPEPAIAIGEILEADISAIDEFHHQRPARIAEPADFHITRERSGTVDCDVVGILRIDQRAMALNGCAFIAHGDQRIVGRVRASDDDRVFLEIERGIASDLNAANEVMPGWDDDPAASDRAGVESILKVGGYIRFAIAGRTELDVRGSWQDCGVGEEAKDQQRRQSVNAFA